MLENSKHLAPWAIGILILVHLSGMVGVSLGYESWFIEKTPMNLLLGMLLLILVFPVDNLKKAGFFALFFTLGMLVEWIGVQYGFLFGEYAYGENLGPKLDGVPWLIGVNWAVLVFVTGAVANRFSDSIRVRVILGAILMVFLDLFMEASAPRFEFWAFELDPVPLQNYLAWFIVACIMHFLFQIARIKGHFGFSFSLYLVQLIFFAYFYVLYYL